jgi:hypothetical protein
MPSDYAVQTALKLNSLALIALDEASPSLPQPAYCSETRLQ